MWDWGCAQDSVMDSVMEADWLLSQLLSFFDFSNDLCRCPWVLELESILIFYFFNTFTLRSFASDVLCTEPLSPVEFVSSDSPWRVGELAKVHDQVVTFLRGNFSQTREDR